MLSIEFRFVVYISRLVCGVFGLSPPLKEKLLGKTDLQIDTAKWEMSGWTSHWNWHIPAFLVFENPIFA